MAASNRKLTNNVSLSFKAVTTGNVVVLYCKGRIVFHHEALALSRAVGEILDRERQIVLDFQDITAIDSAGLGELVSLHMWAEAKEASMKLAGLTSRVRHLLELTNLSSLFEIYATDKEAIEGFTRKIA